MHSVKSYEEASNAIQDIVYNAKIPLIAMVAILEAAKHRLLTEHMVNEKAKEAMKFFAALQKEAEKKSASRGVA